MKAGVYDLDGNKVKDIELPKQFEEEFRPDIIKRAVLAIQSNKRQSYGAYEFAGMRPSAKLSRRRKDYKTAYGHGISRVPRKSLWVRGARMGWVGAFAPGMRKGRKAHPPKAERDYSKDINVKERRKAIRSAIAATMMKEIVSARGHRFEKFPLIVESKFEDMKNTKGVKEILLKLGLVNELERISYKKIRAGKGKVRGRKYRTKKGPLIIVSKECSLRRAASNIKGIDVGIVNMLNAELLAPGTMAGRLTIFTEGAIEKLRKENLFFDKK